MPPPLELTVAVSVTEAPAVMDALEDVRVVAVATGGGGVACELDDPEPQPEQTETKVHIASKTGTKKAEIKRHM